MLKVGHVQLDTNLLLAPIAGHCDLPFRLTARACGGVGLAFTDLLCPHGILKQNTQTQWLMATNEDDRPLGMQLYGQDADLMCEAGRWAVERGATTLDINMGCPVDKVTKTFAGSMMLCTPDNTLAVARALVRAVDVPVTAKLRLGYGEGELTAPSLARALVDEGVQCITIHGRTAYQRFKGVCDLDGIRKVVEAVHETGANEIPCIGNGDIKTPFDAKRMIDVTGCDGVMIARAALGAPWIFRDTRQLLETGEIVDELTLRERCGVIKAHYRWMLEMRDTRRAVNRMKQIVHGYAKHLGPCKSLKQGVKEVIFEAPERLLDVVDEFVERVGSAADDVPVSWREREYQLAASAGAGAVA